MRCLWIVGLALLVATPARTAPDLLDVVPANASVVVGATGIKPVLAKFDKVVTEVDPTQGGIGAVAELLFAQLGLANSLDRHAPLAFVVANPRDVTGQPFGLNAPPNIEQYFVGCVGYLDDQKLAQDLRLDPQQIQPGKVFTARHDNFPGGMKALVKDKRLYFGSNEKAVLSVFGARRLRDDLSREQADTLARADALVVVSPQTWGDEWKNGTTQFRALFPPLAPDADKFFDALRDAVSEVRYFAVGVRLDSGVGVNALAVFPPSPKTAAALAWFNRGGTATLAGLPLPAGPVLFAQAAAGDGPSTTALLPDLDIRELKTIRALWQQFRGDRVALYQTRTPRAGQFAALAVVEAAEPAAVVAEIRKLIPDGKPGTLAFGPTVPEASRDRIEKLIRELGSEDFDTREKATTELATIGQPALPFLEKALDSTDAEVVRRARRLYAELNTGATEKRSELLSGRLSVEAPPELAYFAAAEKRNGAVVDVVRIRLDPRDAALEPKLRDLLGPDWDKVRLVRRDKQVVALFGSDATLLDAALDHLARGEAGLAKSAMLKAFAGHADKERKVEFHWSLVRWLALTDAKAEAAFKDEDRAGISSLAFSAGPDRLQLDLWMPSSEIRGIVHLIRQQPQFGFGP